MLLICEGPQLRATHILKGINANEYLDELGGKSVLNVKKLDELRFVFAFPRSCLEPNQNFYVRKRGGKAGLKICKGPHVVVSAARTFAVYVENYLVVPPRQIGIVSPTEDKTFLKALALYLSSDFALYHQFFFATHFGVQRRVITLNALRQLPIFNGFLERETLKPWEELHAKLSKLKPRHLDEDSSDSQQMLLTDTDNLPELLRVLNNLVSDALELTDRERALVHDFVHVRLALNDGKVGPEAVNSPRAKEIRLYLSRLKRELDAFTGDAVERRHGVAVVHDDLSGMVQVDFTKDQTSAREIVVHRADHPEAKLLEKTRQRLRETRAQWVYFDRNLRIYEGRRTYLFKPMQRFHWTESQAMVDAAEIIAKNLEGTPIKA